jgi:hypothetical protein
MRPVALLASVCLLLSGGCGREAPVRVEDRNLGIIAVFPGQPRLHKYSEPTPFGDMEWFSTTYEAPGRLDRSFFIDVGNLPPGEQGGSTATEVLATLRRFLTKRMGQIAVLDLAAARGPGFRYRSQLPNGEYADGIAIVRRGRIYRAQATVSKAEDAESKTFLDSFVVLP